MKILAFAGSTRKQSLNKVVIKTAVEFLMAEQYNIKSIDLEDYSMPLYDGDIEANSGIPEPALKIKELLKQHQIFIIASPEYNGSCSAVLKNTIDWCSRKHNNEDGLIGFKGKFIILLSAAHSNFGGIPGLISLQNIFQHIGCIVLPNKLTIPKAHEEIIEQQMSPDSKQRLYKVLQQNISIVQKLIV